MTRCSALVRAVLGACLAAASARAALAQPAPADSAEPAPPVASAPAPTAVTPPPAAAPAAPLTDADLESLAAAEVIEIEDTAPAESASSVHLDRSELQYRSRTQVSDILRQVPGLMVSQHAGGGKSDQYFIRGFDADHGTDIAIFADDMPVNMPSHGHGQGYADTHFLIPETIDAVDVHKGPYAARFGDFYTAGAMELKTLDEVAGPTIWIAGGVPLAGPKAFDQYNRRIVGMASPELRDHAAHPDDKAIVAVQIGDTDGPFDHPQHFRQGNALGKWQGGVGAGELKVEMMWYEAAWNASGQVPESAVSSGLIDRFGSLDPSEGGDTSRTAVSLGYTRRDDHGGAWRANAYGIGYRFRLFSDFTLYARDPAHGDEIEQTDTRFIYGANFAYDRRFDLGGMDTLLTVGAQSRNDDVETGLWHDQDRQRLAGCFDKAQNPCNNNADHIRTQSAYAEANLHVVPHVHVLPGLRFDQYVWDVEDLDPATRTDPTATTGGTASAALLSPKLSVEIEATPQLDLFANSGYGFHSNDARGNVETAGKGALARALGAEVGVRTSLIPHARLSADLWYLHLDSELVWNGDEGGTAAQGPTERYGVDLEGTWSPLPCLRLDANASIAHAAYVANAGNGGALALAPRLMGSGGITYLHGASFVALRGRGIADRPGNDAGTLTAQGYFILDLMAGTQLAERLGLNLTVNNLLDSAWREAQFADTSAVTPTSPAVEQMHFTPGIPLTVTGTVSYQF